MTPFWLRRRYGLRWPWRASETTQIIAGALLIAGGLILFIYEGFMIALFMGWTK